MPSSFNSDQAADRKHDLRKTVDFAPAGADAHTIAMLARAKTTDFNDAVDLIDAFAKACASTAVADALKEAHARTMAILEAPQTHKGMLR
jgi:hypothetical protein